MSMKVIEIIISPQGEARVQTKGFAGAACQEASRFLEKALGQRTKEQLTAEFRPIGHYPSATTARRLTPAVRLPFRRSHTCN